MSRRLTCIVPVFDAARHLPEALDSIAAQTVPFDEVIVVDDGSSDGSAEVARAHPLRPRVIRQANAGPAAARNAGLAVATGDFVGFLDADDLWHPDKTRRQLAALDAEPAALFAICDYANVTDPRFGSPETTAWHATLQSAPVRGRVLQCMLAHRTVFDLVGILDVRFRRHGEDSEWFSRAVEMGAGAVTMPEVLVTRRLHDRNVTASFGNAQRRDMTLELIHRMIGLRRGSWSPPA